MPCFWLNLENIYNRNFLILCFFRFQNRISPIFASFQQEKMCYKVYQNSAKSISLVRSIHVFFDCENSFSKKYLGREILLNYETSTSDFKGNYAFNSFYPN